MKVRMKKGIAFLSAMAMVVGLVPDMGERELMTAQAAETTTAVKTIEGLDVSMIVNPTAPKSESSAWKGSYVYFGHYDTDGDGTAEPVRYRVLDASTTDYSNDGTTKTMLLDCDSCLYFTQFDVEYPYDNTWKGSPMYNGLNGDSFLNKDGVLTAAEKNAIAESTVAGHELTTESENGVNVSETCKNNFQNYVALTGEKIFLLDAEDMCNVAYGYSNDEGPAENRKKRNSDNKGWWLRSAFSDESFCDVGHADRMGSVNHFGVFYSRNIPGVSPAMNLDLSSVLFSTVISGTAGKTGAEYKLTLLDDAMTIVPGSDVTRNSNTVTIPYTISGDNSSNATQVSMLILDKKYTQGNTNNATILAYEKMDVVNGNATYTLQNTLSYKESGKDYYAYVIAEDVNEKNETDFASRPVEVSIPKGSQRQMNFGTQGILDPGIPSDTNNAWAGCYVWYGKYDTDGDGIADPLKYRVLDASTTEFSEDGMKPTMLLDCDSILYFSAFDDDGIPNAEGKDENDWSISDPKNSLNGIDFLNKEGVFTTAEKNAIATSTKSEASSNDGSGHDDLAYAPLVDEKIFLLDAKEVTRESYGYSNTRFPAENRKKKHYDAITNIYWLRSPRYYKAVSVGEVDGGYVGHADVKNDDFGVSPAMNLELSSVLFSSANAVSKSSVLGSNSIEIGTTTDTDWKLTLKDTGKSVKLTDGESVTKASDGTITVPYTYTDLAESDAEKVNQISVMITDKAYDSDYSKDAQILYYGALQNVTNAEGSAGTVAESSTGIGTFELPSSLKGTWGEDYHIYLLAEHVNKDNVTDYAGEPVEVILKNETTILVDGDVITDDRLSAKVEVSDAQKKEVTYKEPVNKKASTVTIPSTVKIGGIPYKVTGIADNAFKDNKNITKVKIGNNIKSIGKNAFKNATKLKNISIGKNIKEIGDNAFKGCSSLTSVTLPGKIGSNVLSKCKKLKTLIIKAKTLKSKEISKDAFKGLTKGTTIKVPKKLLSFCKKLLKKKGLSSKVKVKGY